MKSDSAASRQDAATYMGVDLSGPANTAGTAVVVFERVRRGLRLSGYELGVGDLRLHDWAASLCRGASLTVGLDAPLSYQPGGGDRPGDHELRALVRAAGLPSGTVMTPTMTRMAYLTLRGIAVSRMLGALAGTPPRIVEVHPGAVMALRGAPIADLRAMKRAAASRSRLLAWLDAQGAGGARALPADSDHLVAACACALAAWKWSRGEWAWRMSAAPPAHPYDFVA